MKIIYLLLFAVALSACRITNKTPCSDYGSYIIFNNLDSSIGDTVVNYMAYIKGGKPLYAVDSGAILIEFAPQIQKALIRLPVKPSLKGGFGGYDWKFVFRLSGKTFLFTEITFNQIFVAQRKYKDHSCTNDLSFKVNDSLYKIPGEDGVSMQYIHVDY